MAMVAALLAVTMATGLASLSRTEYANGWDGYYYLVQIKSLHTTGSMHSREYSPVYLPMLAIHTLSGNYVTSARLSAVLIKGLFVLSVFVLTLSLLREGPEGNGTAAFQTALTAASLSSLSPSLNYFFSQFPKNLLGFALFFLFAALLPGSQCPRGRRAVFRASWAALLFFAAFFTHRFSAVLSLAYLALFYCPALFAWLKRSFRTGGKKPARPRWLWMAPAVFIMATVLVSQRLPLALSTHDLELVSGEMSSRPVLVPHAFLQCFGALRTTALWRIEIIAGGLLPVVTLALMLRGGAFRSAIPGRGFRALLVIAMAGLFPFLSFNPMSLSYRLYFGTLLMLPIVAIPYIRLLVGAVSRPGEGSGPLRKAAPVMVFAALLAVSPVTGNTYDPELHDPPYEFYEHLSQLCAEALEDSDFVVVIAHKALAEMITFSQGMDALPWSPEGSFPRERVWRITAGIVRDEVAMYLSPETADRYFIRLAGDYALLREDCWEAFLESIAHEPVMLEAVYTWRNPTRLRPGYLMKGRS